MYFHKYFIIFRQGANKIQCPFLIFACFFSHFVQREKYEDFFLIMLNHILDKICLFRSVSKMAFWTINQDAADHWLATADLVGTWVPKMWKQGKKIASQFSLQSLFAMKSNSNQTDCLWAVEKIKCVIVIQRDYKINITFTYFVQFGQPRGIM